MLPCFNFRFKLGYFESGETISDDYLKNVFQQNSVLNIAQSIREHSIQSVIILFILLILYHKSLSTHLTKYKFQSDFKEPSPVSAKTLCLLCLTAIKCRISKLGVFSNPKQKGDLNPINVITTATNTVIIVYSLYRYQPFLILL